MDSHLSFCSSSIGLGALPEHRLGVPLCLAPFILAGEGREVMCQTLSHHGARHWRLLKAIKTKENTWDSAGATEQLFTGILHPTKHTMAAKTLTLLPTHALSSITFSQPLPPHPHTPTPLTPSTAPAILSELAHTADAESSLLSQPQTLARKINSNLASSQPHVILDKPVLYAIHQIKPGRRSLRTEGSSNPLPGQPWHRLIYLPPHGPALVRGAPARPNL